MTAKLDATPLAMIKNGHLGGYISGGDPATWCPALWSWVVRAHGIRSVLDVGCGEGHSTRFFRELGCEVLGVEGCARAVAESVVPGQVVRHDFCEGAYLAGRSFDLVWSCEFVEHVEEAYVPNILKTFAQSARMILMTHAFPGQEDGYHHVNCRSSAYWIRRLEEVGYRCDVEQSLAARRATLADYPGINHFARSGLVFIKDEQARTSALQAAWKAFRINSGFRWSSACRRQLRDRRRQKRLARQRA